MPILCYKLSMIVFKESSVSLLSALLSIGVPSLVVWGAVTTTASLAWIFFLFLVILLLKYVDTGVHLKLITIVFLFIFMTNELFAAVSLPLVLLAYIYRKYSIGSHSISAARLFMVFLTLIFVLPLSFKVRQLITFSPVGPYFSLTPFEKLPTYDAILVLIFGGYAELEFRDALIQGIVPLLGMIGLLYMSLEKEGGFNQKLSRLLFLFFILLEVDYRIIRLFMMDVPFGSGRLWVFQALFVIPFAVFIIYKSVRYFQNRILSRESSFGISRKIRDIKKKSKGFLSTGFRGALVNGLLVLSISGLVTASVYNGYPHYSEAVWTTSYELDAAKFIEATTNETYIVICPPLTRLAGWVVVGPENPRAFYYGAWTQNEVYLRELYAKMIENPSLEFVFEAMQVNNATVVYFIVNKLREAKAEQVMRALAGSPYYELYGVFGEDVYVYRIKPPPSRIVKGVGPSVYVYSLGQRFNTTMTLDIFTYEATYELPLNGSQSYNLTDWPLFWSFESIVPDPISMNVDANNWINFTGSENSVYNVIWTGTTLYQQVGWKDDSFKIGWNVQRFGSGHWLPDEPPIESTDGDVFNLTGFFRDEVREYHWLEKRVENISTDDYPYLLIKWRSTSTNAIAWAYYTDGTAEPILNYASYSPDWTLTIIKLLEGKKVTNLMVGLDDLKDTSGWQQALYDFIMLAKFTKPA